MAGLLLLRQDPGMAPAAGIILVVIAGIGATRAGARTRVRLPGADDLIGARAPAPPGSMIVNTAARVGPGDLD